jgi:hypothetical protein
LIILLITMDFAEQLEQLESRAEDREDHLNTEEATKNALVMPFIRALGYDVFDPAEVMPEFTADLGSKKGEKVDYAIMHDGTPSVLFECKKAGAELSTDHAGQRFRYFHVTDARIGVLTNGVRYKFFSDLEEENKMDERPFLEFDLHDYNDPQVEDLKRLRKSSFDLDEMLEAAHDLKYLKAIRSYFEGQWSDPDEEFVHFVTKRVYDGRITKRVRDQFLGILRKALHQMVHDKVSGRLKNALAEEEASVSESLSDPEETPEDEEELPESVVKKEGDIVTTEEEMEAYRVVRAIMREVVDVDRVTPRDRKTYFTVLLDDNTWKPICKLWFNQDPWYIELILDEEKNSEKRQIDSVDEIY